MVIIILMVGLSRIYLRVHYTSDVIAGFCAGILWLWLAIKILNGIERFRVRWLGG
jgi:undecaprenyl-diphosphatase